MDKLLYNITEISDIGNTFQWTHLYSAVEDMQ